MTNIDYRKYRLIANIILCASFIASLALLLFRHNFWLNILLNLSEAALIASVADSIAIYAITNKIPHVKFTGVIELKRRELIDGITDAFRTKFFKKEELTDMVSHTKFIELLKNFVPLESNFIREKLLGAMGNNREVISKAISNFLEDRLNDIDILDMIKTIITRAEKEGWTDNIIHMVFDNLKNEVKKDSFKYSIKTSFMDAVDQYANEGNVVKRFFKRKIKGISETYNVLNYDDFADKLQVVLEEVFYDLTDKEKESSSVKHEKIKSLISDMFISLSENKEFNELINEVKRNIILGLNIPGIITKFLVSLEQWLEDGKVTWKEIAETYGIELNSDDDEELDINQKIGGLVSTAFSELDKNDEFIQNELEKLAIGFIENEYDECIKIVKDILEKLSNEKLKECVNKVAGGSLQWLRISGACVGLIVGGFLFLVIQWPVIFLPFFVVGFVLVAFFPKVKSRLVRTEVK